MTAAAELNDLIQSGYRYAKSLSGNHQDSEDLVQQAVLKLFRKYGELLNKGVLFKTIRNTFLDQIRRKAIVPFQPLDSAPEGSQNHTFGVSSDIETAFDQLNESERESIYLNSVEGYTAEEISIKTNTPAGTILSRISRGRAKLRHLKREQFA